MSATTVESGTARKIVDGVVDATQRVAQLSHDARAFESAAHELVDEGTRAARRAARQATGALEDFGDDAVHYVKHQPITAMAIAAGAGAIVGLVIGVVTGRASVARPAHQ